MIQMPSVFGWRWPRIRNRQNTRVSEREFFFEEKEVMRMRRRYSFSFFARLLITVKTKMPLLLLSNGRDNAIAFA